MGGLLNGARRLRLVVMLVTLLAAAAWWPVSAQNLNVTALPGGGAIFAHPLDATPDPEGQTVYFVATTEGGEPGVFRVPAEGGDVEVVYAGAPLAAPRSLVISGDGSTLYVADPLAGGGLVFVLPLQGGMQTPVPLVASIRTGARVLDLVSVDGVDQLYIGGTDPQTGGSAVYRVTPADGALETLHTGAPRTVVDGLAAARTGEVYIAAPTSETDAAGRVFRLRDGTLETLVEPVLLGRPAGMALALDERTLFISSLAADGASQVVVANLTTGAVVTFSDVIGVNHDSGGLHRAHNRDVFAWASIGRDRGAGGNIGNVYGLAAGVVAPESATE